MQNQTISQLYILKSGKIFKKNFTPKRNFPKLLLLNLSTKRTTRKHPMNNNLCEAEMPTFENQMRVKLASSEPASQLL